VYTNVEKKPSPDFDNNVSLKTVGFIVNPIAGMGGAVGLKGTDGKAILKRAITLGAKPVAPARAESFLSELKHVKGRIQLIVGAGGMGEDEARNCGFVFKVLGKRKEKTTAENTINIAKGITALDANLLVFCGGDGTARDVLDAVDTNLPVLGVPTGVKMHSAVFAVGPQAAARIAIEFLWEKLPLRETEVMDVDEEAFREGQLSAKLYGYTLTPYEPSLIQGVKMGSPMTENELRNQAAIAIYVIEQMKPDVVYIVGPGTTTRTVADLLHEKKTLLGVDLLCNKKLIGKDVNEKQILKKIRGKNAQIIVTPIGGQGFIFGRGNQQISPAVIRQVGRDNISVISTEGKMRKLKKLRVDTGDPGLDETLRMGIKVATDYKKERVMCVE
jgi:predicted polyphosphate/ATP-dependent NAD kinase